MCAPTRHELAELTRRVEALERLQFRGKTVRGFAAAARVLECSVSTVMRRFKADPSFPRPARVNPHRLKRVCPEWSFSSLAKYRNGSTE